MNHHPTPGGSQWVPSGSGPTCTGWVPDPLPLRGGTHPKDPPNPPEWVPEPGTHSHHPNHTPHNHPRNPARSPHGTGVAART